MLKDYLKKYTIEDLQNFFKTSHVKPYAFNSIEDINFCSPAQEKTMLDLFIFACEMGQKINNPYIIVLAFTGGFKNKNRFKWPYRNGMDVLYEVDNTQLELPEVTEKDFQELLQYQKNAV